MSENLSIDLNALQQHISRLEDVIAHAGQAHTSFKETTENLHHGFGVQAASQVKQVVSDTQGSLDSNIQDLYNSLHNIHQHLVQIKDGFESASQSAADNIGAAFGQPQQ